MTTYVHYSLNGTVGHLNRGLGARPPGEGDVTAENQKSQMPGGGGGGGGGEDC